VKRHVGTRAVDRLHRRGDVDRDRRRRARGVVRDNGEHAERDGDPDDHEETPH
jgi:hypothetical protein